MLGLGYFLTIAVFMIAARRAGRQMRDAAALPFYCFLHAVALVIAVVELVVAPSYWAKTQHGLVDSAQRPRSAASV